jgi:hypothetical protein
LQLIFILYHFTFKGYQGGKEEAPQAYYKQTLADRHSGEGRNLEIKKTGLPGQARQ